MQRLDREIERVASMIASGREITLVGHYDDGRYANNHVRFDLLMSAEDYLEYLKAKRSKS